MRARTLALSLAATLFGGGGWLLAEQGWLAAKAWLAGRLVDRAFEAHLLDGADHPPWPWADTHPIARLEVPRLGIRRTVLSGASGPSLAFGPGHVDGTARPNGPGNSVLAGHRDSWFAFLEDLAVGDEVVVRTRDGTRSYRVVDRSVRSMWDAGVLDAAGGDRLTLVTCWPFDGLLPGTRRYAVTCR